VLASLYVAYLVILWRVPPQPQTEESLEDLGAVPRAVLKWVGWRRIGAIAGLFIGGGVVLYFVVHPFVESLRALAFTLGISEFFFVQWVAPFLSEFPEKTSAFYWARKSRGAPMALMNMVSSNINQWTVLAAMIPVVYGVSLGAFEPLRFDAEQRVEILLTILQSLVAFLLLCNMRFRWWEAAVLFILWFVQFLRPSLHFEVALGYGAWGAGILIVYGWKGQLRAPALFWRIATGRYKPRA
jgi:cation:H+ antiporter